jgi:Leucine-rich repeat (LRR) protein
MLTKLDCLIAKNNRLEKLSNITYIKRLRILNLCDNRIEDITGISKYRFLEYLYLSKMLDI